MVLICRERRRPDCVVHAMLPRRVVLPWYPHGARCSADPLWLREEMHPVVAVLRMLTTEFRENLPDCGPDAPAIWPGRGPPCAVCLPPATAAAPARGSAPGVRPREASFISCGTSSEASFAMLLSISGGATPISKYSFRCRVSLAVNPPSSCSSSRFVGTSRHCWNSKDAISAGSGPPAGRQSRRPKALGQESRLHSAAHPRSAPRRPVPPARFEHVWSGEGRARPLSALPARAGAYPRGRG